PAPSSARSATATDNPACQATARSGVVATTRQSGHYACVTNWLSGLLLGSWLLLEVVLRRGENARKWQGGDADRSSTRLVVVTYVVAFIAPFLLDTSGVGVTNTDSAL